MTLNSHLLLCEVHGLIGVLSLVDETWGAVFGPIKEREPHPALSAAALTEFHL